MCYMPCSIFLTGGIILRGNTSLKVAVSRFGTDEFCEYVHIVAEITGFFLQFLFSLLVVYFMFHGDITNAVICLFEIVVYITNWKKIGFIWLLAITFLSELLGYKIIIIFILLAVGIASITYFMLFVLDSEHRI